MNISRPVITRLIVGLAALVAVTGILGPWIIRTRLLYDFHFFIYGNVGKLIIFSAVATLIMSRKRLSTFIVPPYRNRNLLLFIPAYVALVLFCIGAPQLLHEKSFTSNLPFSLCIHTAAIATVAFSITAAMGLEFVMSFATRFFREMVISAAISLIYYFGIFYLWQFWPLFSRFVLYAVYYVYKPFFSPVVIVPPLGIYVQTFAVTIEQACSGIDSIFLFSTLYVLIGIMEWDRIKKIRFLIMLPFALIGLFAVNIMRVYILILAGIYTSPQITITLFHTYIGMLFFLVYFILFWKLLYRWLRK